MDNLCAQVQKRFLLNRISVLTTSEEAENDEKKWIKQEISVIYFWSAFGLSSFITKAND